MQAGMVAVGIHGTYDEDAAVNVISKVNCTALLFMRDLALEKRRADAGRWAVQHIQRRCPSVKYFVVMDAQADEVEMDDTGSLGSATTSASASTSTATSITANAITNISTISGGCDASFLEWVSPAAHDRITAVALPDPFDARGAEFSSDDGGGGDAGGGGDDRVTTILFTSGTSGSPKAAAVGLQAFLYDLGDAAADRRGACTGVTVS